MKSKQEIRQSRFYAGDARRAGRRSCGARAKFRSRLGFTMIEILTVLTLIGILAAVAVPSMVGFIEHGKQINRSNVARTIYLAAQNQITKAMLDKNLKSTLAAPYYTPVDGVYSDEPDAGSTGRNNVHEALTSNGAAGLTDDSDDNRLHIHYISKPKGYTLGTDSEIDVFYNMLAEVIMDNVILNDAILMEYNVKTGVVLSVFYGDTPDSVTSFSFGYSNISDNASTNVTGGRSEGDGYAFAALRKQGYYGVSATGVLPVVTLEDIVNIYDGAATGTSLEGRYKNLLYAELLLATDGSNLLENSYAFELVNADDDSIVLDSLTFNFSAWGASTPTSLDTALSGNMLYQNNSAEPVVQYGVDVSGFYKRYIWVIDYVGGDTFGQPHSIGGAITPQEVRVKATRASTGANVTSATSANSHFARVLSNGSFELKSARHLNNIRYAAGGNFRQTADIDLLEPNNLVTNFMPVDGLTGSYYALRDRNTQYRIENLNIVTPSGYTSAGLFTGVGGSIQGLAIHGATITSLSAHSVGAIAGILENGGIIRQSYSYANVTAGDIDGGSVGGLVGANVGGTIDQCFNAGYYDALSATSGGMGTVTAGGSYIGGLAGYNSGTVQNSFNNARVNISDVTVESFLSCSPTPTSITPSSGGSYLGGVAGHNSGVVRNTYATNFVAIYEEADVYSGGITGYGSTAPVNSFYILNGCSDAGGITKAELAAAFSSGAFSSGRPYAAGQNAYAQYPYPVLSNNNLFSVTGWGWEDIKEAESTAAAQLAYYELYDDDTWGFSGNDFHDDTIAATPSSLMLLNDGYCAEFTYSSGGYTLALGGDTYKITLATGTSLSCTVTDDAGVPQPPDIWIAVQPFTATDGLETYRLFIPNSVLKDITGSSASIEIKIFNGADADTDADEPLDFKTLNPLYAPAEYGVIRSPRHIGNIGSNPGGSYVQQLNTDFAPYRTELKVSTASGTHEVNTEKTMPTSNSVVTGTFTGNYDGNGMFIKNITVSINSNNLGLFAQIGTAAAVRNITLINPSVSGRDYVGAVCGTLNGTLTNAYVSFTDNTSGITGHSYVGGIAGINNGSLTNSVFISPHDTVPINRDAPSSNSVGGIVGVNGSSATLRDIQFLALAPLNIAGTEVQPIAGTNNNTALAGSTDLIYLSGTAIRPNTVAGKVYNTFPSSGLGIAKGTNEITPLGNIETALRLDNEDYPYPTYASAQVQLAGYPNWPIAAKGGEITINDITYYEKYDDGSYGTWFVSDGAGHGTLIGSNTKVIAEAGYAVILNHSLSLDHYLYARPGGTSADWDVSDQIEKIDLRNNTAEAIGISAAAKKPGSYVYRFPLATLSLMSTQSIPLQIMYTLDASAGNPQQIYGYLQPLFAKGVYAGDTVPDPDTFYVRTTWQMRNISVLTSVDHTGGITFAQELNIDFKHTGAGVSSVDGSAVTDLTAPAVQGTFKGTYTGKVIKNASISSTESNVGLFSENSGTIQNITLADAVITGASGSAYYVGGIAGTNAGTIFNTSVETATITSMGGNSYAGGIAGQSSNKIDTCFVKNAAVTSSGTGTGGISGLNSANVLKSGVMFSTVGGGSNIGGVVGLNSGIIDDVFFLSVADIDALPVPNNGGGIVGTNSGTVSHALYLAHAPRSVSGGTTTIYPIVRSGNDAAQSESSAGSRETCFYLSGYRYSLNEGKNWIADDYNRVIASSPGTVLLSGGGSGLVTAFFDKEWLSYAYAADLKNWEQPSSGYPYPVVSGLPVPTNWPEADSPVRPDQKDRDDWEETHSTSGRAQNLGFVNGSFTDGNFSSLPVVDDPGNSRRLYVDMQYVNGWYTRPVLASAFNTIFNGNQGNPTASWKLMELQEPTNVSNQDMLHQYAYSNYQGNFNSSRAIRTSAYRYAELNAEVQGTLYQVCATTPGAQFYYSFYHTSRTGGANATISDDMSFYLSGIADDAKITVENATELAARDSALTLIRPCRSPRTSRSNVVPSGSASNATAWNTAAWNTVSYGQFNMSYHRGRSYLQYDGTMKDQSIPAGGNVYVYDVWIGSTSGNNRTGTGITFWSNSNRNNLNQSGYTTLNNLLSAAPEAGTNVIGYWGVEYGWKHYYGLYTVPAGQNRTEFAYQSRRSDAQNGNYLDGISFKSPAFLSIDKYIKMGNTDIKYVKPGDTVTVELKVKSWGELKADNIVIKDQLYPFDEYIEFVAGSVSVKKGSTAIAGCTVTAPNAVNKQTLSVSLPPSYALAVNEEITVTFDLKVLERVKSNNITDTLLYFFKNQAVVEYLDDKTNNDYKLTAYINNVKKNASGPEPVQIFIDPISLSKTVKTVGVSSNDPLIDGPFEVTLTIENTLEGRSVSTTGLVNDLIPKGFELTSNGTLPASTVITKNSDGTTRISIRDVNIDEQHEKIEYTYTLKYTGSGYGVAYTNSSADYKYLYSDKDNSTPLNVMLNFPKPVVGIKIKTRDDAFSTSGTEKQVFDITANDDFFQALADDNYEVTPEVVLTDSSGTPVGKNGDGNYFLNHEKYSAVLSKGNNRLEFSPKSGTEGSFELYYYIRLTATKTGGTPESFDLSSRVTKINVYVASKDMLVYYEKYGDNDYGLFGGVSVPVPYALSNTKNIVETGYGVMSTATSLVVKKDNDLINSPTHVDLGTNVHLYVIDKLPSVPSSAVYNYELSKVEAGSPSTSLNPLGSYHPNFAMAVYDTAATDAGSDFYIRTHLQMQNINLVDTTGKNFIQNRELDFTGVDLNADGAVVKDEFKGTFDGGGHSIKNVTIDATALDNVGLFRQNSGTITGVVLATTTSIKGKDNVGGIAGLNNANGNITGCTVQGNTDGTGMHIEGNNNVGGIAGKNEGTITDCIVQNTTNTVKGNDFVGGIAGLNETTGSISGATVSAVKIIATGSNAGALCGSNLNTSADAVDGEVTDTTVYGSPVDSGGGDDDDSGVIEANFLGSVLINVINALVLAGLLRLFLMIKIV